MNRQFKGKLGETGAQLPLKIDSVWETNKGYFIEYDGWHFEEKTLRKTFNKVLEYIFLGGPYE